MSAAPIWSRLRGRKLVECVLDRMDSVGLAGRPSFEVPVGDELNVVVMGDTRVLTSLIGCVTLREELEAFIVASRRRRSSNGAPAELVSKLCSRLLRGLETPLLNSPDDLRVIREDRGPASPKRCFKNTVWGTTSNLGSSTSPVVLNNFSASGSRLGRVVKLQHCKRTVQAPRKSTSRSQQQVSKYNLA